MFLLSSFVLPFIYIPLFPPTHPPHLSAVHPTGSAPAAPQPAEPPAARPQTDVRKWRRAAAAADSGSDQQHEHGKCQRAKLHHPSSNSGQGGVTGQKAV